MLEAFMVIGISHEDMKKLRASQKNKPKIRPRKNRTTVLSKKSKDKAFKKIDQSPLAKSMAASQAPEIESFIKSRPIKMVLRRWMMMLTAWLPSGLISHNRYSNQNEVNVAG